MDTAVLNIAHQPNEPRKTPAASTGSGAVPCAMRAGVAARNSTGVTGFARASTMALP